VIEKSEKERVWQKGGAKWWEGAELEEVMANVWNLGGGVAQRFTSDNR
jgi:hypothetical protein